MNIVLSTFVRLPNALRRTISQHYFSKSNSTGLLPPSAWALDCLDHLLFLHGKCLHMDAKEAVIEFPYPSARGITNVRAAIRHGESSDLTVFKQILIYKEYKAVVDFIAKHCKSTKQFRIVDAGANVGYTTIYLGLTYPDAHIVSIEPDKANFRQLQFNTQANSLTNVETLNAGLWRCNAYLRVVNDFRDNLEWSLRVCESAEKTDLQGKSIPELMAERNWDVIDLLKIDIEGAERYLVETDELAAQMLQHTRFIAMEIHDEYEIRPRIYDRLRHHGFEFFDQGELTIGRNTHLTEPAG